MNKKKKKVENKVQTLYNINGPIDWEFMKPLRDAREKMIERILKTYHKKQDNE